MSLPLLHRHTKPAEQPCWMCLHEQGVPLKDTAHIKTLCDRHRARIRRNATAQAQPGYGLGTPDPDVARDQYYVRLEDV